MSQSTLSYTIEEVSNPQSPHLMGMCCWLEKIFPEYAPPRFEALLTQLRRGNDRHEIQLFVALIDDQVVGLVQVLYREWQQGLMADIDLLGVLEPYRRLGLGSGLVQRSLLAAREIAVQYERPAIGVVSLVDAHYDPVIRLHDKLGGQVRTDYSYPSGDTIVWYPLMDGFVNIETQVLAQQLQQFGRLLERGLGIIA